MALPLFWDSRKISTEVQKTSHTNSNNTESCLKLHSPDRSIHLVHKFKFIKQLLYKIQNKGKKLPVNQTGDVIKWCLKKVLPTMICGRGKPTQPCVQINTHNDKLMFVIIRFPLCNMMVTGIELICDEKITGPDPFVIHLSDFWAVDNCNRLEAL